ncbi:MAG: BatA and WFA domain-containing protein [Candidatus Krumholzibacteriota bacterium]|nr:BatA and WFA domain-containing protein [Candidatus Krumholzibacteriota bacterium]
MDFLNPFFLIMLGAVGVPILIHFFSRKKIPEIVFSSLIFLRGSQRRSMRRIDFRRLLLLLVRMAGVALIALAFARPVIKGGLAAVFPGKGSAAIAILLDRSYSMSVEEGEETVFEKGADRALEIIRELNEEDEAAIFLFDTKVEKIFEAERFRAAPVFDLLKLQAPSFFGTDLAAAFAAAREHLLSSRKEIRELYIISDFQKSGLGDARSLLNDQKNDEGADKGVSGKKKERIRSFLIPVGGETGQNVSIDRVITPGAVVHRGESAAISVVMKNHSPVLEAQFPLRISLDAKRILEREIRIAPGSSRTESVEVPIERSGWIEGEASKRPDRLSVDDRRVFTIHSREKDKVLLISDGESFYLEQALSPREEDEEIILLRRKWDDLVTADLDWADLAVVGPGQEPAERDISIIKEFVSKGGGLLALVTKGHERLIKALSLNGPSIDYSGREETVEAISRDVEKPLFLSPFDREDMKSLLDLRFRGTPMISGVDRGDIDLWFSNGSPFVWSERTGKGRMIFAAVDPRPEGGDLVLSPLFLPLIRQLLLAMDPEPGRSGSVEIGEKFIWDREGQDSFTVTLPDGSEYLPAEETEGAPGSSGGSGHGSRGSLIPAGDFPGFLRIEGPKGALLVLGVNPLSFRESDLAVAAPGEAADSLRLEDVMIIPEKADISAHMKRAREGREISVPLILAAIFLFVVELFIAQRKDMAEGGTAKDVE